MRYDVIKGFHSRGELYAAGTEIDGENFEPEILKWLASRGCIQASHEEPAERKPKRKKEG